MHDRAQGYIASTSGDRSPRFREYQFAGIRELGVVDLAQLACDSADGRAIVLAGLDVLEHALGRDCSPRTGRDDGAAETLALLIEGTARVASGATRALADGRVEAHEVAGLGPAFAELKARVADLESALARAAVQPYHRPAVRPIEVRRG